MKALLINPSIRRGKTGSFRGAKKSHRRRYPSGLYSIAAVLEALGFQAPVLDLEVEDLDVEKAIRRERPDVVGITSATANRFEAIDAARRIREVSSDLVIVVGGPHFTFTAEDTLRNIQEIDVVVRGEGEGSMLELMQTLEGGTSLERIAGISYGANGQINHNPDRPAIGDLDELPAINWEHIPWEKYDYRFMNMPCAHIQTSRGCPMNCTFCSTTKLEFWVTYIQNTNGCSGYSSPTSYVNISKTGGLLVEFYYLGDDNTTARVQNALGCVNTKWNDPPNGWYGNKGHAYAMFSVFKGLELLEVATIPNAPANTETPAGDWWGDYSEFLAGGSYQNGDGSWPGYSNWNEWLSTGWYIVILQATVFPVEVDVQVPDCACEDDGYTVTVDYSVERFLADGELRVYQDDTLYATVLLEDFQGSATESYPIALDTPGTHTWKAVLDVIGGGITAIVEDVDALNVCETPQVASIPDDTTPFETFDLDDYLTYGGGLPVTWSVSGVPLGWTVTIDGDNVVTVTAPAGATDPEDITFMASVDCCPEVACSDSDTVTFTPNRPPECSPAYASVDKLWPPNHEFHAIDVLGVTDPDGHSVSINIDSIYQDEPVDTHGDGTFTPDGVGIDTPTASVRAERSGTYKVPGDGRVYHISFTATDELGLFCEGMVNVSVPHDKKATAIDGGPLFDSTALAPAP